MRRGVRATYPTRDGRVRHAHASQRGRGAESPAEGVRARRRRWRAPREEATRGRARGPGRGERGRSRAEQGGEAGGEEGAESGEVGVAGAGHGRAGHRAREDGFTRVGQPGPIGPSRRGDGALVLEAVDRERPRRRAEAAEELRVQGAGRLREVLRVPRGPSFVSRLEGGAPRPGHGQKAVPLPDQPAGREVPLAQGRGQALRVLGRHADGER